MRDSIMNEQYFREYIQEEENRVKKFTSKLEKNEVKEERILAVKRKIDSINFGIFVAKYSVGEQLEMIKPLFLKLINNMEQFWGENSSYIDMLWMMSIAIMYDVDKEEFAKLSKLVDKYERNDALLDFLTNYKLNGVIQLSDEKFSFSDPYEHLKRIIQERNNKEQLLKDYLQNNWYQGHKEMAWYDIHKAKEKLYYGYWSFESGAIAKILDLDDINLKNVKYYPYDLVHYKK